MRVGAIRVAREIYPDMTNGFVNHINETLSDIEVYDTPDHIVFTGVCDQFDTYDHVSRSDVLSRVYPEYSLNYDRVSGKYWFSPIYNQYFCI